MKKYLISAVLVLALLVSGFFVWQTYYKGQGPEKNPTENSSLKENKQTEQKTEDISAEQLQKQKDEIIKQLEDLKE